MEVGGLRHNPAISHPGKRPDTPFTRGWVDSMQESENFTRGFHSLTPSQRVQGSYEKLENEVTINRKYYL